MRKALLIMALAVTTITFLNGCDKGGDDTPSNNNCTGITPSFSAEVNPIIQSFCNQATCHASGSTNGPGPLTNYAQVFAARTSIRDQVAAGLMPQNTTLTSAQKQAIICWVNNGAPNN